MYFSPPLIPCSFVCALSAEGLLATATHPLPNATHPAATQAIAAAKAGIQGLALATAASYASQNIRVNCVAPGLVRNRDTTSSHSAPRSPAVSIFPPQHLAPLAIETRSFRTDV